MAPSRTSCRLAASRVSGARGRTYGVRGVTYYYDASDRFVVERKVSTYGHSSPYTTSWNTGNLTEGSVLGLEVCVGTTSNEKCAYLDNLVRA